MSLKTTKERDRKSDPIDSGKLSRELANNSLTGIYVPDIHHEALRCLHRLYTDFLKRKYSDRTRGSRRVAGGLPEKLGLAQFG
jgi:hypothetical protein